MKKNVVIGFIGTQLDARFGAERWERWRPTVALGMHEDFVVHRMELLIDMRRGARLAKQIAADLAQVSPETEVCLHDTYIANPWDFESMYGALHDFCARQSFDPEHEDYYAHITTGTHVAQICLFLLTESRHLPGRLLQTSPPRARQDVAGAYSIIDLDLSKYDRIAQRFEQQQQEDRSFLKSGIATRNAAFNTMIEQIETVAIRSPAPMLLMGPTGAGKSQLARRVYELKRQRGTVSGAFVEINCATLRGDGAMSALFGHRKGAFTGAVSERAGLLRSADRGVLFLDEIGELGADEQAMLLRAIEDKRFLPVGSDREVCSDFQLIAGTNRDLGREIASGGFRDDLYARLNLWTFELPGLAARREDIEPNLDYELERYERSTHQRVRFNVEARERYLRFAMSADAQWPGNFRDLGASVSRMATLAVAGRIQVDGVDAEIARLRRLWRSADAPAMAADVDFEALLGERVAELDRFDRAQLGDVVAVCRRSRNLSEAGRTLFAASRQTRRSTNDSDRLRKYLARFGLSWSDVTVS
ncbi:RNA repair transcriptional activator RtcR [Solimonas marina]|uniref:Sigma 54-interacting transcriptional regulator n=1 Tax=Solimonas marina TaxID=2714601 RepID=A0A969W5D9_9GAMM|nr:RNA repair transcriptional activator RtcR [Solimonas marina]NKF20897.1 sigma 54-interacting transcriptional regulator [Solimonas marina]